MIDQIKPKNLGSDFKSGKVSADSTTKTQSKVAKVDQTKPNIDSNLGKVSQFISKEKVKKMASEPPIDKTAVTRIKTAIANGTYPLDLEKLADALLQAHKEIK